VPASVWPPPQDPYAPAPLITTVVVSGTGGEQ